MLCLGWVVDQKTYLDALEALDYVPDPSGELGPLRDYLSDSSPSFAGILCYWEVPLNCLRSRSRAPLKEHPMTFAQKILAPTDFSPAAELALDAAAILAKQLGASVVLLYVYDPSLLSPFFALPGAATVVDVTPRTPGFEESVRQEMERLRAERLAGVTHVEFVVKQHPSAAHGICDAAGEAGADLIVMSTHGRTGLAHMLIGSVAERVVRHAPCPVLTLRSKAK